MIELLQQQGFQVLKKLGGGSFGQVFLVHHPKFGILAAKVIMKQDFAAAEWDIAGILSKDLSKISPFIVRYIAAQRFEKMIILLMEYANCGTLQQLIKTQKDISIPVIRVIIRQMLESLKYIHSFGIIHRDIKGGNIMLHSPPGSERVILKLADFGEIKNAKFDPLQPMEMTFRGTPQYMAPEFFQSLFYEKVQADAKIDIWSLGIIVYQLETHSFPFDPRNEQSIRLFMTRKVLDRPYQITDNLLWDLLQRMLDFDRNTRISEDQALMHPFFTGEQTMREISLQQYQLAQTAQYSQKIGNSNITPFDINPQYIFPLTEVKKIIGP
ncbi:MAG: putative serine/threonine-protein kinase 10, partial [Streblomastix strix]